MPGGTERYYPHFANLYRYTPCLDLPFAQRHCTTALQFLYFLRQTTDISEVVFVKDNIVFRQFSVDRLKNGGLLNYSNFFGYAGAAQTQFAQENCCKVFTGCGRPFSIAFLLIMFCLTLKNSKSLAVRPSARHSSTGFASVDFYYVFHQTNKI